MKRIRVQARDGVIEHVREQMERGIVEIVRTRQNLRDVFPTDALDPGVGDHVLRIVNSEETEPKIACVESSSGQSAQ